MKNTRIHSIAVKYFEGNISFEEEVELYDFVKASKENDLLFRKWEDEWFEDLESGKNIVCKQNINNKSVGKSISLIPFKRIIEYAAAAIISFAVFEGVHYFTKPEEKAEEFFIVETSNGERSKVVLADGTSVWLNAGSTLKYGSQFNSKNREVELYGEAYFEVTKQPGEIPFTVKTQNYDVVVKGTKFNVTSYSDDDETTTTLLEGKINVRYGNKDIAVLPGEEVLLDKTSGKISHYNTDVSQSNSWIDGSLRFDSISLKELSKRLSRKYDVDIILDDNLDGKTEFRITLQSQETVDNVLNALSQIIPIKYKKYNDRILILKQ